MSLFDLGRSRVHVGPMLKLKLMLTQCDAAVVEVEGNLTGHVIKKGRWRNFTIKESPCTSMTSSAQ